MYAMPFLPIFDVEISCTYGSLLEGPYFHDPPEVILSESPPYAATSS